MSKKNSAPYFQSEDEFNDLYEREIAEFKKMGIETHDNEIGDPIDSDLSLAMHLEELDRLSGGGPFNPMDGREPKFRIKPTEKS